MSTAHVPDLIDPARVVELAERICRIPTPASNEAAVAEILYHELGRAGADVHVEEVVAGRANLVARVPGRGDRAPLVLSGHLDAALAPHGWTTDPLDPTVRDGRLYAAGIDDMKGAVAAMAATIEVARRVDLPGDLVLHAVMHHDTIGLGEKYVLASEGPREGYAICGEPSGLRINVANAGALKFRIDLRGETAHISRARGSRDALAAAVSAYAAVQDLEIDFDPCPELPDLPMLLVGRMEGGTDGGKVAESATLFGDVRTVPGMDRRRLREQLETAVVSACRDDIDVDVRITAVQRPFIGNRRGALVDAVSSVHHHVRGTACEVGTWLPGEAFVTDAADLSVAGLETVVYGPGDWHHGPDRSLGLDELVDTARIYLGVACTLGAV